MPIREHPKLGTVVTCSFLGGFKEPEMVKRRPVVVISPKMSKRGDVCTVVCLSTSPPLHIMPYHQQIDIRPKLPARWASDGIWVKGDMVYTVAFHRLDLLSHGKDKSGKRIYHFDTISDGNLRIVRECVLRGMGLSILTKHLG